MSFKDFLTNVVKDVEIDLTQAFDRNFETKSFFNQKWASSKYPNSRGSQMMRSGKLRRSVKNTNANGSIKWSSNVPYASIHNEGGEIVVTQKMKSFFWAMYYKAAGAVTGESTQRNKKLTGEAGKWKAMALMKVGTVMTIEQRQFIGWHPVVDMRIKAIANTNFMELSKSLTQKLQK